MCFVDRMPYVEATILELMRYKTTVAVTMHATLNDTEVGGYFVPRGTMVLLPRQVAVRELL